MNHKNPPHLRWSYKVNDKGRTGWFAHAREDVEKGVQVFTSYGKHSNQYMYPVYGFIDPENDMDFDIYLTLKLGKNDPLRKLK